MRDLTVTTWTLEGMTMFTRIGHKSARLASQFGRHLAAVAFLTAALAGLADPASSQTLITVCPSGCNYDSIQTAVDHLGPDVTVQITGGTYNMPNPLKITAGGTNLHPAVIQTIGGPVILDCTLNYSSTGLWTVHGQNHVYQTAIAFPHINTSDPASSQLFVNAVKDTFVADTIYTTLPVGYWAYDAGAGLLYAHIAGDGNPGAQATYISDYQRRQGIQVLGTTGYLTINGLTVQRSYDKGIDVEGSGAGIPSVTVENCTVIDNFKQGIYFKNTQGGLITGNSTHDNRSHGIHVYHSSNCSITRNTSSFNENPDPKRSGITGIRVGDDTVSTDCGYINVDYNTVHDNEDTGIEIHAGHRVLVRRNVTYHNKDHGFDDNFADSVAFINNTAFRNVHDGLSVENGSTNIWAYNNIFVHDALNPATLAGGTGDVHELYIDNTTGFHSNNNILCPTKEAISTGHRYLVTYGTGPNPANYSDLATYQSGTGQDASSYTTFPAFSDTSNFSFGIYDGSDNVVDAATTIINNNSGWTTPMWLSLDPVGIGPHNAQKTDTGSGYNGSPPYMDIGAFEYDPKPGAATTLAAQCDDDNVGRYMLTWTATSDDSLSNGDPVASYDVRYSTSPITEQNWGETTTSVGGPVPLNPGSGQVWWVYAPETRYVRFRAIDANGNLSWLSGEVEIDPSVDAAACNDAWYGSGGGGGGGGGCTHFCDGGLVAHAPTLSSLRRPGGGVDTASAGENTVLNGTPAGTQGADLLPIEAVQNRAGLYLAYVRVTGGYGTLVDGLKMLFVDHPVGTETFALGSTVVSGQRSQASHAVSGTSEDVTNLLNGSGGIFNGGVDVTVTVSTPLDSMQTPLVIECANGGMGSHAIIVETQSPSGWRESGRVYPRRISSATVIDSVPAGPVRLRFAGYAQVSSVARLANETANVTSAWGRLEGAASASAGDVLAALSNGDSVATTLVGPDTLWAAYSGPTLGQDVVRDAFLAVSATPVTGSAATSYRASRLSAIPTKFALYQNAPNPFWGSTTIRLDLPVGRMVRLEIFDVSGRRVRMLVNHFMPAGRQSITWNQRDDAGATLGAGVYFARVQVDTFRDRKKLTLMP